MIDSVTRSNSFGFDGLKPPGGKGQPGAARVPTGEGRDVGSGNGELTTEQQRQADQLKTTDRKVRAHEQAHMAAGGDLVLGSAVYSYQTGPDKQRYAVAGEVSIDTSKAKTPEETIVKAARIRQAALAPIDPSPQDRRVAAYASQIEMQARQELVQKAAEARTQADSERNGKAIGAYQAAGGLEISTGFSVRA